MDDQANSRTEPPPALAPWRRLPTCCHYCTAPATYRAYADRGWVAFADGFALDYDLTRYWDVCDPHCDRLFSEVPEVGVANEIRDSWKAWWFHHYLSHRVGRWLDRRLRPYLYQEDEGDPPDVTVYI